MTDLRCCSLILAVALGAGCGSHGAPAADQVVGRVGPAGAIFRGLPATVDPDARYLLYLHNRFLEVAAPGDRHPTFGPYEYQAILDALAERRLAVIAEQREPDADPAEWANRVAHQIRSLEAAGVPPERISVVGFSKGGVIAILASSELADDRVNFVFIAACGGWTDSVPGLAPRGRMLSIREASDDSAGSCEPLLARAPAGSETREIELHLGGGHGAFFTPRDEWIEPVVAWAGGGG